MKTHYNYIKIKHNKYQQQKKNENQLRKIIRSHENIALNSDLNSCINVSDCTLTFFIEAVNS